MTMNILDAHSVARCGGALLRVKLPPEIDILPCVEVNIDNAFELSRDSSFKVNVETNLLYLSCKQSCYLSIVMIRRGTGLQMYTFDFCCFSI